MNGNIININSHDNRVNNTLKKDILYEVKKDYISSSIIENEDYSHKDTMINYINKNYAPFLRNLTC